MKPAALSLEGGNDYPPPQADFSTSDTFSGEENQHFIMDLLQLSGMQSPDSGVGLDLAEIEAEDSSPMLSDVMMTGGEPFYSDATAMLSCTTPSLDQHNINLDINMLTDEDLFMMDSLAEEEQHHDDNLPSAAADDENISEPVVSAEDDELQQRLSPPLPTTSDKESNADPEYLPVAASRTKKAAAISTQNIHSYSTTTASPKKNKKKLTPEQALRKIQGSSKKISRSEQNRLKKIKLYEVAAPLANPEAEKCRLNAINAKKNRERKKAQLEVAQKQIEELKSENRALRQEANSVREDLDCALQEIQQLKSLMKLAGLPVDDREE